MYPSDREKADKPEDFSGSARSAELVEVIRRVRNRWRLKLALRGAVVVQPLVESIHTHGEVSVYVIDGRVTQRFDKFPAGPGEVRVHEEFGGVVRPVETGDVGDLARQAYDAMAERFGRPIDYLRVDLLRWEGAWAVSELELIEPGLYLDVSPANAGPFADLVQSGLGR